MLVLGRKTNEAIVINGNIIVQVVEIRGDKVRLGVVAPREVPVDRYEIHAAKTAGVEAPETYEVHDDIEATYDLGNPVG